MPLEGTAGALRGGSHSLPIEDTSPDVKDSRPPLLLHPRNCPAPFSWLPRPSSCTQSASRTSRCQRTLNALTSVFSQTSPLHSKHLHPTWLPAALWSFTRAAGLTPTRPYFHNLHHEQKPLVGREHLHPALSATSNLSANPVGSTVHMHPASLRLSLPPLCPFSPSRHHRSGGSSAPGGRLFLTQFQGDLLKTRIRSHVTPLLKHFHDFPSHSEKEAKS